jgi:hypothetical protein
MFRTHRLTGTAALAAALLAAGGCESPPAEVATIQSAMNGSRVLVNCFFFEPGDIDSALALAVPLVRDNPAAMTECMKDAILSFENWNVNPAFPEDILGRVGANNTTFILCADIGERSGTSTSEFPGVTEAVALDHDFLFEGDVPRIAAVLVHEVSHTRGYKHPKAPSFPAGVDRRDYFHSVPEQLEQCLHSQIVNGAAIPHGRRRSSFSAETTLAKVGGLGGANFELGCPSAHWAHALNVRTGDLVDNIGLGCRSPFSGHTVDTATTGGGGGSFVGRLECFPGEVLVGMHGRAGEKVDAVGPICASVEEVRNGGSQVFRDPTAGGGGGVPWDRLCPRFMALRGLRGKSGNLVDQLELDCRNINRSDSPIVGNITRIAPPATGNNHKSLERCAGRSALVGLTVSSGNLVDRLGGLCREVATVSGVDRLNNTVDPHIMASNGGEGGGANELLCGLGEAVVGLQGRSGDLVDAIGPVCANTVTWTDLSFFPETHDGPVAGGGGGGPYRTMCPRGQLLVGWEVSFTIAGVFTLVPQCRDF